MNTHNLLIGIIFSMVMNNVYAQVQEMTTDRPDQSNTPVLIPKGALQIETGVIIEKDNREGRNCINYAYNNTLIKFGVNDNFEGRLAFGYLGVKQIADETSVQKGLAPITLGVKIKLVDQNGLWPQMGLISNVTLKTGAEYFKPPFTCTDITFALLQTLNKWYITYNAGVKWNGDTPEANWLYAISAEYNITNKLSMFIESYGFFPEAHRADHRMDAGVTFKIYPRLQLDASGGIGLSSSSPKFFISTGFSIRLFK